MIQKVIQKRRREAEIREQLKVGVRSTGGYCTHVMYIHILVRKFLAISKKFNSYFLEYIYFFGYCTHCTCAHTPTHYLPVRFPPVFPPVFIYLENVLLYYEII